VSLTQLPNQLTNHFVSASTNLSDYPSYQSSTVMVTLTLTLMTPTILTSEKIPSVDFLLLGSRVCSPSEECLKYQECVVRMKEPRLKSSRECCSSPSPQPPSLVTNEVVRGLLGLEKLTWVDAVPAIPPAHSGAGDILLLYPQALLLASLLQSLHALEAEAPYFLASNPQPLVPVDPRHAEG
jgi:hypothetical protein